MPTSEPQKRANKKWRENNRERYNNICKEAVRKNYIENKDAISLRKAKWYLFKRETELFRHILLI
jgi:hypothetical protein